MDGSNGEAVDTFERDGGPAFPTVINDDAEPSPIWFEGMTLRDYFAAQALAGILSANPKVSNVYADEAQLKAVARLSYDLSDAMIKARK